MTTQKRLCHWLPHVVAALAAACLAASLPAADRIPKDDQSAIPSIGSIESELAVLENKNDARITDRKKSDLPEATTELSGSIRASDQVEIEKLRQWTDDSSPYGVSFSGAGLVSIELPKKALEEGRKDAHVLFVTFSIKPALSSNPEEFSYLSASGAVLAFALEPPTMGIRAGRILVLNGGAKQAKRSDWVDVGVSYPVNAAYEADMPLGFMLRIDATRGEWDLFLMQQLRYAGIFHTGSEERLWIKSAGAGATEVSELSSAADNPLFEDKDADGIEDAIEIELGFSSDTNDRGNLDELGQFSNLQHFINRRKSYPSRQQVELEATLIEAITAADAGRTDHDLEKRGIPQDHRRRHFTKDDIDRMRAEAQRRLIRFGRPVEEPGEKPEGGQP